MTFCRNGLVGDISIYCPGGKGCLSSKFKLNIGGHMRPRRWIVPRVVPSSVPPAGTQAVRRYVRRYGTYFSIGSYFDNSSTPNSKPNSYNITAVQLGWNITRLPSASILRISPMNSCCHNLRASIKIPSVTAFNLPDLNFFFQRLLYLFGL
jgi:hypothetical protein